MTDGRCRRPRIVFQDLAQGGELARMHVGTGRSNVSQRRWLERALELHASGDHVPQLGALIWLRVTVGAQAVELIVAYLERTLRPSDVLRQADTGGDAGVVKMVVGEERSVFSALRIAARSFFSTACT